MNVMYLIERVLLLFSVLFILSVLARSSTKFMPSTTISSDQDSSSISSSDGTSTTESYSEVSDSSVYPSYSSTTLDTFNINDSVTSYEDSNIEYSTHSVFTSGITGGKWNVTCYNATTNIAVRINIHLLLKLINTDLNFCLIFDCF